MKRTLMFGNRELLDFEADPVTGRARVLDAPAEDDATLAALGLGGPHRDAALSRLVSDRCLSSQRADLPEILSAFGARSSIELALMGHGASLADRFWYRMPGAAERWEDVNFFDNDWDGAFCLSVLTGDYGNLAACSPDIPDITTKGILRKAWEQSAEGVFLVKESLREDGADLEGSLLASELCALLFEREAYQPLTVQERYGRRFSASPLMLSRDEELVQNSRLFAMCGIQSKNANELQGPASPQNLSDVFSRFGIADPSAHAAKIATFKNLALLADIHAGNYGIVRNAETGALRPAPLFDFDRSFGFPSTDFPLENFCNNPKLAMLLCARDFSDLDSSWDWGWYNPQNLEGFENRIEKAFAPYPGLPPTFGNLVAQLFAMQRSYVNEIASA